MPKTCRLVHKKNKHPKGCLFSLETYCNQILLQALHRALDKALESFALEQTVLQQAEVNKLSNMAVVAVDDLADHRIDFVVDDELSEVKGNAEVQHARAVDQIGAALGGQ